MRTTRNPRLTFGAGVVTAVALALAACGGDGDSSAADPTTSSAETTDATGSETDLAADVEDVLGDVIDPETVQPHGQPAPIPPTAAVAAIRIPERDDLLVAVGANVDGSPTVADAPFLAASLAESLVRSVAFQLVDEGVLDPDATVDRWAPTAPNADRVTVQMLLDNTTGWGDWGVIEPDPVTSDFARAWTLPEVVEARAPAIAVLGEPGTESDDVGNGETVLGLIIEEATGRSLIDLVAERVSEPAGLDVTGLADGSTTAPDLRHGVFDFQGTEVVTSDFDPTSYLTFNLANVGSVATTTDLLDLLDVWETGELFTTDRTPAPDRYSPEPAEHEFIEFHSGIGVPFNAFCPCTPVDGGIEPAAIGRTPASIGTSTAMLRFDDGISVVVNANSNGGAELIDLVSVTEELHELAAATVED